MEINKLNLGLINNNHQSNKIKKINRLILIKNYVKILKKINLEKSINFGEFVVVKNIKK